MYTRILPDDGQSNRPKHVVEGIYYILFVVFPKQKIWIQLILIWLISSHITKKIPKIWVWNHQTCQISLA